MLQRDTQELASPEQHRLNIEDANVALAKRDSLIVIDRRMHTLMKRMTVKGQIKTYVEPIEQDRVRDNNY